MIGTDACLPAYEPPTTFSCPTLPWRLYLLPTCPTGWVRVGPTGTVCLPAYYLLYLCYLCLPVLCYKWRLPNFPTSTLPATYHTYHSRLSLPSLSPFFGFLDGVHSLSSSLPTTLPGERDRRDFPTCLPFHFSVYSSILTLFPHSMPCALLLPTSGLPSACLLLFFWRLYQHAYLLPATYSKLILEQGGGTSIWRGGSSGGTR